MTPSELPVNGHLSEGTLIRRLDEELSPSEAPVVEAHLSTCDRCRTTLSELGAISAEASRWIPEADPGFDFGDNEFVRRSRFRVPLLRAAVVALVVAAAATVGIPSVRAWVSGALGTVREAVVSSAGPSDRVGTGDVGGEAEGLRVAFTPRTDHLRIRVATVQRAGSLVVASAVGDTVGVTVRGGGLGRDDLLVLPDGLVVGNSRRSTADYQVVIPRRIEHAEVLVGGRIVWSGRVSELAKDPFRVSLAEP